MSTPKSTRGDRTRRTRFPARRLLNAPTRQWNAYRLEYFLTAFLEAWGAPEHRLDTLATELFAFECDPRPATAAIDELLDDMPDRRAALLDHAASLLGEFLDGQAQRAWSRLRAAIENEDGQALLAMVRATLDELSRDG